MRNVNRQHTAPLAVPRTNRNHAVAVLTSGQPGKCIPVAAIPLLREDALNGRIRINLEMLETKEILVNPVTARVTAHVVPFLAFERFEGSRDQFDRSYMGQPKVDGGAVVPFVNTTSYLEGVPSGYIENYLGLHPGAAGSARNTAYREAYNTIWNWRAKNRSPHLDLRNAFLGTLAPAFWQHSRFAHVVPDFDQAVIDGEVALNIVDARVPVRGVGLGVAAEFPTPDGGGIKDATGNPAQPGNWTVPTSIYVRGTGSGAAALPDIFGELQANGITVSLSNIELAKKTQAFAKLRQRYEGHDEEYIIDMLMDGLAIPDQALKQPILIADRTVRFGQAKRYATDSGNLDDSAVSGAAVVDLTLRVPRLNTGGIVMVQVEILPEQLFERQGDPFFNSTSHSDWPEYLRDTLDPEKVDVVPNGDIDMAHSDPTGTFGYAPMNWKWNAWGPRLGGKFYCADPEETATEERKRVWAVETIDPTLAEDFYICSEIHNNPFLDEVSDPFEMSAMGNCVINGNTVFGGVLVEATNSYDKVLEKAPVERIEKEA